MAGGPIYPSSIVFTTSSTVGPGVHVGASSTGLRRTRGIQVVAAADLTTDADVEMTFEMPPSSLPAGTPKLRLLGRAAATSGTLTIQVSWVSVAVGEDPSTKAYFSETASGILFAPGDSDVFKEKKVSLVSDTVVAGEIICMKLTFFSGSTVGAVSTWQPSHIWE